MHAPCDTAIIAAKEQPTLALAVRDFPLVLCKEVAAALLRLWGNDDILCLRVLIYPASHALLPTASLRLRIYSTTSCSRRCSCSAMLVSRCRPRYEPLCACCGDLLHRASTFLVASCMVWRH